MKYFSFNIFAILFCSTLTAQNIELNLSSSFGFSQDIFDTDSRWLDKEHRHKYFDFQLDGNYYFLNKNKVRSFIGSGLGYNKKAFQYEIVSLEFGYSINSISLSQDFIYIPLRLGFEYKFLNSNTIGFQFELGNNFLIQNEEQMVLSESNLAINRSLEYNYVFAIQSKNHRSIGFSLYAKTKLLDNLYLTTSIGIVDNGESGFYSHNTNQVQTLTDVNTNESTELHSNFQSNENSIEIDFVSINVGISKYF